MSMTCCEELRQSVVTDSPLNGINFIEVIDKDAAIETDRQRFLKVFFLKDVSGLAFTADNFRISGGERVTNIQVMDSITGVGDENHIITIELDNYGDFSIYTLSLVTAVNDESVPAGIDEKRASIEFSFKVECPSDFDCAPQHDCESAEDSKIDINYLAKDYSSFRTLMLDRLAAIVPGWKNNPADLGVTLVEALAYKADLLSYQQDSIATEAYLNTARKRTSVRRHARLMDYYLSDGCNARTWVHFTVSADVTPIFPATTVLPKASKLFTAIPQQDTIIADNVDIYRWADVAFETMHAARAFFNAHNEMNFYTWSDQQCCLHQGSTAATLQGHLSNLQAGDVLIFEEVIGAETGSEADADINHHHAVVLTEVSFLAADNSALTDPVTGENITKISWHEEDALAFALCVSAQTEAGYLENITVARGNVVLADHGLSIDNENLGVVPEAELFQVSQQQHCQPKNKQAIAVRFNPELAKTPLTQMAPDYQTGEPANSAMSWKLKDVQPAITLQSELNTDQTQWIAKKDLLNSSADAEHFVVEIETDWSANIRFGDDVHGKRAEPGTVFLANYRVGNGKAGNIGADAISHIITDVLEITQVRNPLAAKGGTEQETIKEARQSVPIAFRTQQRAVTEADYAEVSERRTGIQKTAADFRWTGSWHTVFLTADREAGENFSEEFAEELFEHVEPFRMAGHDLNIVKPQYVALEMEINVCVNPNYFRSEVKQALLQVLSNRKLAAERLGFFHADNFTFGQNVYLSTIYTTAQNVAGVDAVKVSKFQRMGVDEIQSINQGWIEIDDMEIARLDNDTNHAEHGKIKITLGGGK